MEPDRKPYTKPVASKNAKFLIRSTESTTVTLGTNDKREEQSQFAPKTFFDQIDIDFVKSGKKPYFYRLVLLGAHDEVPDELISFNLSLITETNNSSHDETVTGFLLLYQKHFVHVMEGSEESLNHYIWGCAQAFENDLQSWKEGEAQRKTELNYTNQESQLKDELTKKLSFPEATMKQRSPTVLSSSNVKIYVVGYFSTQETIHKHVLSRKIKNKITKYFCTHVYTPPAYLKPQGDHMRLITKWFYAKMIPPTPQLEQLHGGFRKNLLHFVKSVVTLAIVMSKHPTLKNGEIDLPDAKMRRRRSESSHWLQYLPTLQLIEYILKDKPRKLKLRTPKEFVDEFWEVPNLVLESEVIWPIPSRLAPYN